MENEKEAAPKIGYVAEDIRSFMEKANAPTGMKARIERFLEGADSALLEDIWTLLEWAHAYGSCADPL